MKAFTGPDAIGIYLTGGATNTSPAASLGGACSEKEVGALGIKVTKPLEGIVIENVSALNGEGEGTLHCNANGYFSYIPPDGLVGHSARLDPDTRAVIRGADTNKSIRVYRRRSGHATGEMKFEFKHPFNGVFAMEDITNAQREGGAVHYRAVMLVNHSPNKVVNITIWQTVLSWTQASFSLGSEAPVAGEIQTIVDEDTAPVDISFSTAEEASPIHIPDLESGEMYGAWIERDFPSSGKISRVEGIILHVKFSEVKTRVPFRLILPRRIYAQDFQFQIGHTLRR